MGKCDAGGHGAVSAAVNRPGLECSIAPVNDAIRPRPCRLGGLGLFLTVVFSIRRLSSRPINWARASSKVSMNAAVCFEVRPPVSKSYLTPSALVADDQSMSTCNDKRNHHGDAGDPRDVASLALDQSLDDRAAQRESDMAPLGSKPPGSNRPGLQFAPRTPTSKRSSSVSRAVGSRRRPSWPWSHPCSRPPTTSSAATSTTAISVPATSTPSTRRKPHSDSFADFKLWDTKSSSARLESQVPA